MNSIFQIQSKELVIINRQDGSITWKGKPKGLDVDLVIDLPSTQECIVLLNWIQANAINTTNLLKINAKGAILWEVAPPQTKILGIERGGPNEVYVDAQLQVNFVIATSFSGFRDYITVQEGTIIRSVFVK